MNKQIKKVLLWIFSVCIVSFLLLVSGLYYVTDAPAEFIKFCKDFSMIKKYYYRPVSDKELLEHAAIGMISSLNDPHSMLITGDKYKNFMHFFNAEYVGIGVSIGQSKDSNIQILSVFPNSPAKASGIQSQDVILSIDGESVKTMNLEMVSQKIKGPSGTSVQIIVRRGDAEIPYEIYRADIKLPTVSADMLTDDIGYIRIFSFLLHTDTEFEEKLNNLRNRGMKKLIIDVRMNPGGMLDTVVSIANKILTSGTVLSFHTKFGDNKIYDIKGVNQTIPMAILIDKHSASASEILAGAMQDKNEGIVIGERSYGKGTVQSIFPDSSNSVLKISIAEYRTAAGRIIDGKGIEPDISMTQTGNVFSLNNDNVLHKAIEVLEEK